MVHSLIMLCKISFHSSSSFEDRLFQSNHSREYSWHADTVICSNAYISTDASEQGVA
jgi:hypothetical protein